MATDDPKMRGILANKKAKRSKGWMTSGNSENISKVVGHADQFWSDPLNRKAFGLQPL